MHRHGYNERKLQMAAGPRRALVRGQMTSLVLHEAITTTEAKAKTVAPEFERLVTTAKKGTLAGGRSLRRELLTENATQKMIQVLAPAFADRHGGYTRIVKLENRRGDSAPMARLSLVLDGVTLADTPEPAAKKAKKAKAKTKQKATAKTTAPANDTKPAAAKQEAKS